MAQPDRATMWCRYPQLQLALSALSTEKLLLQRFAVVSVYPRTTSARPETLSVTLFNFSGDVETETFKLSDRPYHKIRALLETAFTQANSLACFFGPAFPDAERAALRLLAEDEGEVRDNDSLITSHPIAYCLGAKHLAIALRVSGRYPSLSVDTQDAYPAQSSVPHCELVVRALLKHIEMAGPPKDAVPNAVSTPSSMIGTTPSFRRNRSFNSFHKSPSRSQLDSMTAPSSMTKSTGFVPSLRAPSFTPMMKASTTVRVTLSTAVEGDTREIVKHALHALTGESIAPKTVTAVSESKLPTYTVGLSPEYTAVGVLTSARLKAVGGSAYKLDKGTATGISTTINLSPVNVAVSEFGVTFDDISPPSSGFGGGFGLPSAPFTSEPPAQLALALGSITASAPGSWQTTGSQLNTGVGSLVGGFSLNAPSQPTSFSLSPAKQPLERSASALAFPDFNPQSIENSYNFSAEDSSDSGMAIEMAAQGPSVPAMTVVGASPRTEDAGGGLLTDVVSSKPLSVPSSRSASVGCIPDMTKPIEPAPAPQVEAHVDKEVSPTKSEALTPGLVDAATMSSVAPIDPAGIPIAEPGSLGSHGSLEAGGGKALLFAAGLVVGVIAAKLI